MIYPKEFPHPYIAGVCATEVMIRQREKQEAEVMQTIMIVGVYIWGAMYTAGVFVAALAFGNHNAVFLAILSAGAAYAAQFAGALAFDPNGPIKAAWYANLVATAVAVISGAAAGIVLYLGA